MRYVFIKISVLILVEEKNVYCTDLESFYKLRILVMKKIIIGKEILN